MRALPQAAFRLGVFSSASERTVSQVIPMLEAAAGPGPLLFDTPALVLTRAQTDPAPPEHVAGGGDPWDTVKPLGRYFPDLRRVILVDDDHWKVRYFLLAEPCLGMHCPSCSLSVGHALSGTKSSAAPEPYAAASR